MGDQAFEAIHSRNSLKYYEQPPGSGQFGQGWGPSPAISTLNEVSQCIPVKFGVPKEFRTHERRYLSRLPVYATQSDVGGARQLTHQDEVGVYFVGASGHWPRVVTTGSTNSRISILDINTYVYGSRSLIPIPLTDEDFKAPILGGGSIAFLTWIYCFGLGLYRRFVCFTSLAE